MRKFMTWLLLLTKRQLKNPLFIAIIILIPTAAAAVNAIPAIHSGASYTAGIYASCDPTAKELAANLYEYNGFFKFVEYSDLDALYRDVKNTTLTCGYIFPDDLSGRGYPSLQSGTILAIHHPSNIIQPSVNELVYAELLRIQGRSIITDYLESLRGFNESGTEYTEDLMKLYDGYLHGDATFKLTCNTYGAGVMTPQDIGQGAVSFPIRGILAITVFLAGLFGGVTWLRDSENGVFATLTGSYGKICRIIYVLIPPLFLGAVALITLAVLGLFVSAVEFLAMAVLIALSCVFSLFMSLITRKSKNFAACIPVILLGCFIFCNVFINASSYVPSAKFIEKLFVPYYYLKFFS